MELVKQPPMCKWLDMPSLASVFHENPKQFAQVLTNEFLTMKSVIPTAKPSEKEWLKKELEGDMNRHFRARASLVYAQVELEDYIDAALLSLDFLNGKRAGKIAHSMSWSFFAASTIRQSEDVSIFIQKLVDSKLIKRESLPAMWRTFALRSDSDVGISVAHHHRNIADHILTCIMPKVTVQQNP